MGFFDNLKSSLAENRSGFITEGKGYDRDFPPDKFK